MSTETKTKLSPRVGDCPLEQQIAQALDAAGVEYVTGYEGSARLDFYLPAADVFIEVKGAHTPRVSEQLASAQNVILAQGSAAVGYFANLIRSKTLRQD